VKRGTGVLVIEDDPEIRESLADVLSDAGYETVTAIHGRDALEKLESGIAHPKLILLDLMMPVMDGRVFRKEQLQRPALSKIPVIVLSAYQSAAASVELAAAGHLAKPLGLDDLLDLVRRHCEPE
jgi:CheY-like chemotaxis protein